MVVMVGIPRVFHCSVAVLVGAEVLVAAALSVGIHESFRPPRICPWPDLVLSGK